jgi:hypothetical protein
MIKTSVEKLAESIGYDIGMSDDKVQSDLLNGFAKALQNSISSRHALDMQLCYIVDKFDPKTDEIFLNIAEFIKQKNNK